MTSTYKTNMAPTYSAANSLGRYVRNLLFRYSIKSSIDFRQVFYPDTGGRHNKIDVSKAPPLLSVISLYLFVSGYNNGSSTYVTRIPNIRSLTLSLNYSRNLTRLINHNSQINKKAKNNAEPEMPLTRRNWLG